MLRKDMFEHVLCISQTVYLSFDEDPWRSGSQIFLHGVDPRTIVSSKIHFMHHYSSLEARF